MSSDRAKVAEAVRRLKDAGIVVSLFLDPDPAQLEAGIKLGVDAIELHTGAYAQATLRHNLEETQIDAANADQSRSTNSRRRRHAERRTRARPTAT